MPIEVQCDGCGKTLRVGEEFAGQQAKCPSCQNIFTVPDASSAAAVVADRWTMKTPEGQQFGPVTRSELDGWMRDGRMSANCQLLQDGSTQWQWAHQVYPSLGDRSPGPSLTHAASASGSNPFAAAAWTAAAKA